MILGKSTEPDEVLHRWLMWLFPECDIEFLSQQKEKELNQYELRRLQKRFGRATAGRA
jgi:hypothetical protein